MFGEEKLRYSPTDRPTDQPTNAIPTQPAIGENKWMDQVKYLPLPSLGCPRQWPTRRRRRLRQFWLSYLDIWGRQKRGKKGSGFSEPRVWALPAAKSPTSFGGRNFPVTLRQMGAGHSLGGQLEPHPLLLNGNFQFRFRIRKAKHSRYRRRRLLPRPRPSRAAHVPQP